MNWISANLRNYFLALVTLILCAYGYDEASRRLLAVPEIEIVKPKPPTKDASLREELVDLFPPDAWELGDCKRIITGRGTLLFKDWQQIADDEWKLEPLTIVIGRGLASDDAPAPIVLKAPDGAEVRFSRGVDLTGTANKSAPPIKMGRMIGKVTIWRAGNVETHQALHVETSDVRIDKEKVWTTEAIDMTLGTAKLRGSDLTIQLAVSATAATSVDTPSTLLDQMNLVYLDELTIPLDDPNSVLTADASQKLGGIISVTCNNRVRYDFSNDSLTLYDRVAITRRVQDQVLDRIDCDVVNLVLRDPANRTMVRQGPLDWIDKIIAEGHPAVVNLGSQQFLLQAERIDFDAINGLLRTESSEGVRLVRQNLSAHLRNLTYQYSPQYPKELGVIDVVGSGKVQISDPEIAVKNLTWMDSFKLEPIATANIDDIRAGHVEPRFRLEINGNVRAELADDGIAKADQIAGELIAAKQVASPSGTDGEANVATSKAKMTLVPEVFHAMRSVSIDTNQIAVATEQLSLYFERAADLGKQVAKQVVPTSPLVAAVRQPHAASPIVGAKGSLGNLVGFAQPNTADGSLHRPVARPRPEISGEMISAQLLITNDGIEPKDVSINGGVHLKHQIQSADSSLPVEMLGQTMRLIRGGVSQSTGRDILQLGSGPEAPARLIMDDGFFVGPTIKVWPSENRIEVDGAGELKVPTSVLKRDQQPTDSKVSLAGNRTVDRAQPANLGGQGNGDRTAMSNIQWTSNPHCRWGQALTFDGSQAVLSGGVQIDAAMINQGEPWSQRMSGQQMMIALSSPIELLDKETMKSAELQQISLYESQQEAVVVRAEQRDVYNQMQAIHVITSRQLDFLPADQGRIVGTGPGWYRGWMMTDSKSSILSPDVTKTEHLGNQVLQGTHLTYRDAIECDLKSESVAFGGGVRAGIRKVNRWDEVVDVNEMSRLAVGEMTLDCHRLAFGISPGYPKHLRKIPGAKTPWELVADGGVVARSNLEQKGLFELTANRASYQSEKSWLIVEGSPSRSAFVNQTRPDGTQGLRLNSPKIAVNLETYESQTVIQDAQVRNIPLPKRGR
ncbi:hypothetical protein [Roseiconus lacunae]|uniref:Organic solvent tolerance-like N-terminal domain-containing protein n=1 Tax=Roseiconus lacunae TaxID=2605694 RepID=A0ABT7PM07_9BACT|nr:hypothetical protein [Roseiconus lacunae]MDM4017321.1 hypothetical protein [Roseiconus lacunae]